MNTDFAGINKVSQSGIYQLPISYYPNISIYVNNKRVSLQSNDKLYIILPLEKGTNIIKIHDNIDSDARRLILVGILIALVLSITLLINSFRGSEFIDTQST